MKILFKRFTCCRNYFVLGLAPAWLHGSIILDEFCWPWICWNLVLVVSPSVDKRELGHVLGPGLVQSTYCHHSVYLHSSVNFHLSSAWSEDRVSKFQYSIKFGEALVTASWMDWMGDVWKTWAALFCSFRTREGAATICCIYPIIYRNNKRVLNTAKNVCSSFFVG